MTTNENANRPGTTTTVKKNEEGASARAGAAKANAASSTSRGGPVASTPAQLAAPSAGRREPPAVKTKLTYEERMRALAPIVRVRRKAESTIKRFANLADEIRRWKNAPDLREAASKVEAALAGLLAEATTTADNFEPEKERKAGANQLKPGTRLALRDKFVARYEGVLDADERANLEVVTTARGHVSVKTATGARIVLPRSHVAKAPDAA